MGNLRRLARGSKGASLTEYALIIALLAVVMIAVLGGLSGGMRTTFNRVTTALGGTPAP